MEEKLLWVQIVREEPSEEARRKSHRWAGLSVQLLRKSYEVILQFEETH